MKIFIRNAGMQESGSKHVARTPIISFASFFLPSCLPDKKLFSACLLAVSFFVPSCFIPCKSNSDCNRGEACNVSTGKCEIQTDAGNPMAAYTGATPVVTFTMPLDGTVGVPPQSTLSVVFSTPMNALSLTSQTFLVFSPDGGPMEGTRVADPVLPIWTFTPVFAYANQQPTTVTITTGAQSLVGVALATPYTFTFVSVTQ